MGKMLSLCCILAIFVSYNVSAMEKILISKESIWKGLTLKDNQYEVKGTKSSYWRSWIKVDLSKKYIFQAKVKSTGKATIYLGFLNKKNGKIIRSFNVNTVAGTETELITPCNIGDKFVKIKSNKNWKVSKFGRLAFNVDSSGEFSDLPNFATSDKGITKISKISNGWQIELSKPCKKSYPAGTKVREQHEGSSYNYAVIKKLNKKSDEWQFVIGTTEKCAKNGLITGKFWSGTQKVQPMLLIIQAKNVTTYIKNIELKEVVDNIPSGAVNVKDFGAVGDGKNDDTKSIQNALSFAARQRKPLRVGQVKDFTGGAGDAAVPMIIFPSGIYKTSDTLVGYREMYLKGIGKVVIKQVNPQKDIYYQHRMYRADIENIGFDGGKNQLRFWSMNNNATTIIINNCRFNNSSSEAIRTRSFCTKRLEGKKWTRTTPVSPCKILKDKNGAYKFAGEKDLTILTHWRNSTILMISNSEFKNCIRAFNIGTDGMTVENCKIVANPQTIGPIMIGKDRKLELKNVSCYAPASKNKQYWIESDLFNITCRNSKFESVNPMCVIKQVKKPWYESACIIVDNCQFNSAGCPEGAVIDLQEVPNTLYFTANRESSGKKVNTVAWRKPKTVEFFNDNRYFKSIAVESQFNFCIARNSSNIISNLPESTKQFIRPDVPPKLLAQVDFKDKNIFTSNYSADIKNPVFAVDYGVIADGKTDDSAAVQLALNAAAKLPQSAVIFPGKIIKLNKTVKLPSKIILIGNGCTYFLGDGSCTAFSGVATQYLLMKNIGFERFMSALDIKTKASHKSEVLIYGCKFYNCSEATIKCISNKPGEQNKTIFQVKNSLLNGRTVVDTNASYSLLSNIWLQGNWFINNQAHIVNRDGVMLVESVLIVPQCLKGQMRTHRPSGKKIAWKFGDNVRIFDNYGKLVIKDTRFGGESGAPCAVFSMSPEASVFMQGGFTSMENKYTKNCYIYFVKPAKAAVFMANNNIPGQKKRAVWIKAPECDEISPDSVFISAPGVGLPVVKDKDGIMNAYWKY
jgi:Pectate lyase superfamily protein